jgi:hypothetical protein
MPKLSERAVLSQLSLSMWTARKQDKRVTREAISANGAADGAGRFHKALLPMCEALENVHGAGREVRRFFYENTLDWGIEGTRLLPSARYLDFMTALRKRKDDWEYLVGLFVTDYTDFVSEARVSLGAMFNAEDYPDPSVIRDKFKMAVNIMPVPETDFRVDLPEAETDSLKAAVGERLLEAQQVAMRDVWTRLYDVVQKAHEKLASPDAIFRDSLIENVREMCAILPQLNVMDDEKLEELRTDALLKLGIAKPEALRLDPALRSQKAADAKAIMDKMSGLFGE